MSTGDGATEGEEVDTGLGVWVGVGSGVGLGDGEGIGVGDIVGKGVGEEIRGVSFELMMFVFSGEVDSRMITPERIAKMITMAIGASPF